MLAELSDASPLTPVAALSSPSAPTTIVSPEIATGSPNRSRPSGFDALRYACCDQTPAVRWKTYAAPAAGAALFAWSPFTPGALLSSFDAPTTIVSPKIATATPNWSFEAVFEALRYAVSVHAEPVRTKTYAAPAPDFESFVWSPFTPVALLRSSGAPITIVFPEIATARPNESFDSVFEAFA